MKITLLGSAITDLPSTSIVLPQETSSDPFSQLSGVSATQNKNLLQTFVLELLHTSHTVTVLVAYRTNSTNKLR
jgi:hypothetical protein